MGDRRFGIDPGMLDRTAEEVRSAMEIGGQVCLVIGGGNIFRGVSGAAGAVERTSADYMGMLATVMNALAMQSVLERVGVDTRVQSAIPMPTVCGPLFAAAPSGTWKKDGVIFAAGTGNPFTTGRRRRSAPWR